MLFANIHLPAPRRKCRRELVPAPWFIPCPSRFPQRPSRGLPPALSLPFRSALAPTRDREGPHGLPPPTPPDVRGTYPAVRRVESVRRGKAEKSERAEERVRK